MSALSERTWFSASTADAHAFRDRVQNLGPRSRRRDVSKGLRRLHRPRRQEERRLRFGYRRLDRESARARRAKNGALSASTRRPARGAIPTATLELHCDGETSATPRPATGRSTRSFVRWNAFWGSRQSSRSSRCGASRAAKTLSARSRSRSSPAGRKFHGKGVSTDIIEASARAYLKALNKVVADGNAGEAAQKLEVARGV